MKSKPLFNARRCAVCMALSSLLAIPSYAQTPANMPADIVKPTPPYKAVTQSTAGADKPATASEPGPLKPGVHRDPAKTMPGMQAIQSTRPVQGGNMKSAMMDMHDKMMAMKSTGNIDLDFATMMRVHHEGAIVMSEALLEKSQDQQMRTLAKDIIHAQKKEIATMDKYLARQGARGNSTQKSSTKP